jgi:hypothetical protein
MGDPIPSYFTIDLIDPSEEDIDVKIELNYKSPILISENDNISEDTYCDPDLFGSI